MVAKLNGLEEARLEHFLFGPGRISLEAVRVALHDMQGGACFYCGKPVPGRGHVDHFIPWSRYPEDGLANLVFADETCNIKKRDFLAATPHVEQWAERLTSPSLNQIQAALQWDAAIVEMRGVARGIYLRLPNNAMLWLSGSTFVNPDIEALRSALA